MCYDAIVSKIIGFNADERLKMMASALAQRLGYQDVSALMRAILEEKIQETFTEKEREQLLDLLSPTDKSLPKAKAGRRR